MREEVVWVIWQFRVFQIDVYKIFVKGDVKIQVWRVYLVYGYVSQNFLQLVGFMLVVCLRQKVFIIKVR